MLPSDRSVPPDEVVRAAARRLSLTAYLAGGVFLLYTVLYLLVWPEESNTVGDIIGWIEVGLALLVAVRVPGCSERHVIVAATVYQFALCLGIEVGNLAASGQQHHSNFISWSSVVIVFFPNLLVARPSVILLGSLLAASTGPLTYWGARTFADFPELSNSAILSGNLPLVVAAILAYVPAKVLYELGAEVSRAHHLGSYELLEKLGKGGMGEVWTARHRLLARPAAIKLIRADIQDDKLASRFEREAQVTALLESFHTVQLYDFGVSDRGTFYYVMELLRGVDFEALVDKTGPLPPPRVVHLLLQVCESLHEAHTKGLVHRDVKPANLFVTRQSETYDFVKVLDFGLVKQSDAVVAENALTETAGGKIIGTPAYLSPELTMGDQVVDGRSDLYALGCVAYYLLSGRLVFDASSPLKMAVAHATSAPRSLVELSDGQVPMNLSAIVLQCLEKDVAKRPASALALAELLRDCKLDGDWSSESARIWWSEHLPNTFVSSSSLSTQSAPSTQKRLNPALRT